MKKKVTLICEGCGAEYPDDQEEELLQHERRCQNKVRVWAVKVRFIMGYDPEPRVEVIETRYPAHALVGLVMQPKAGSFSDELYWVQCTTDESAVPEIELKLRLMARDDLLKYAQAILTVESSHRTEPDH